MKEVYQRSHVSGPYKGDCLTACVASILEVPIDDVPHFNSPTWRDKLNEYLIKFSLYSLCLPYALYSSVVQGYHISVLYVASLKLCHAVVGLNGKLIFDPSGLNFQYKYVPISIEAFSKLF